MAQQEAIKEIPIYVAATEDFRVAKTFTDLQDAARRHDARIRPLRFSGDPKKEGIYWSIRNAYKYYLDIMKKRT